MPRKTRRKQVLNTVDATVRVSRALDALFEEDEEDDVLAKRRRLSEPEDDEWDPPGRVTGMRSYAK
jgi:hypothetical protein